MAEAKQIAQEIIETLRREVHFERRNLQPATTLYVTVEDRLRVLIFNSVAGAEVDLQLRMQMPDGQVIPYVRQLLPSSNRASNSFEQDLAEGFLLDCSVSTPTAGLRAGACYVVVQIIRGTGANAIVVRSLLANYVTTGMSVGWPEGPSASSVQGQGVVLAVPVSNPAAGADWTVTVPTGARWQVQGVTATLATSATVATRVPQFEIRDAGGVLLYTQGGASVAAGVAASQFSWTGGVPQQANNQRAIEPLPDFCWLAQGMAIDTTTASIQVGDQWSSIRILVVEWIEQ